MNKYACRIIIKQKTISIFVARITHLTNDAYMLKIAKEDGRYLVSLFQVNKLNTLFSELIFQQLSDLVSEPGRKVIFNLQGVRFIDSSGFATLIRTTEIARAKSAEFKICNVSDEVMELIELTQLKDKLPICECLEVREKIIMELDD